MNDLPGKNRAEPHRTVTLTARAKAHGWNAAFGGGIVRLEERQTGRGERRQTTLRHLNVPANLPLEIALTGAERWVGGATRWPARTRQNDDVGGIALIRSAIRRA